MKTIPTKIGEFRVRASAVEISVYRSTRHMRANGQPIGPGDYFAIGHTKRPSFVPPMMYGGTLSGRFDVDGTELPMPDEGASRFVRLSPLDYAALRGIVRDVACPTFTESSDRVNVARRILSFIPE